MVWHTYAHTEIEDRPVTKVNILGTESHHLGGISAGQSDCIVIQFAINIV